MNNYFLHLQRFEKPAHFNFIFLAFLLNLSFFSWLYLSGKETGLLVLLGIGMSLAYIVFHVMTKRNLLKKFQPGAAFFFLVVVWIFAEEVLPALLNAMFIVAVIFLNRRIKIAVNHDGIFVNTIPSKSWPWNSLSNVVMKDGLLTIDFKNNKLIQWQIEEYTDEYAFNQFCENNVRT